jgi:hypothetical protein
MCAHVVRAPIDVLQVDVQKLDFHYYLPLFCTGLVETDDPYAFLAEQGIRDMLYQGGAEKIIPVIPQLILPIKRKSRIN